MVTLAGSSWVDLFMSPDGAVIFMFVAMATVSIVGIVAGQWRRVRLGEAESALKLRMVEKGYSADQIERVLQARMDHRRRRKTARQPDFVVPTGGT